MAIFDNCFSRAEFNSANPDRMPLASGWSDEPGYLCFSQWSDTPDAEGMYTYAYRQLTPDGQVIGSSDLRTDTPYNRPPTPSRLSFPDATSTTPRAAPRATAQGLSVQGLIGAGVATAAFVGLLAVFSRRA